MHAALECSQHAKCMDRGGATGPEATRQAQRPGGVHTQWVHKCSPYVLSTWLPLGMTSLHSVWALTQPSPQSRAGAATSWPVCS